MAEESTRRGAGWRLALAAVLQILGSIGALVLSVGIGTSLKPGPGTAVGLALIVVPVLAVTLVVWAALFFGFTPERNWRRGVGYFVVLLLVPVVVLGGLFALRHQSRQTRQAEQEAAQIHALLGDVDKAAAIVLTHRSGSVDLPTRNPGEVGRIARATKTMMNAVNDAGNRVNDDLAKLGFPRVLTMDNLASDPGFAKARSTIAAVRAEIAAYNRDMDKAEDDFRAVLSGASIDAGEKHTALAGLDARVAAEKDRRSKEAVFETGAMDELEATLRDLERTRGGYRFTAAGVLMFSDRRALDLYKGHMEKFRARLEEGLKLKQAKP